MKDFFERNKKPNITRYWSYKNIENEMLSNDLHYGISELNSESKHLMI